MDKQQITHREDIPLVMYHDCQENVNNVLSGGNSLRRIPATGSTIKIHSKAYKSNEINSL